jgi:large subunit ribosomal protein L24
MKVKLNDKVKILSGKDRGKTGKVIQVLNNLNKGQWFVVVEGLNMRKKHLKTNQKGEKGRIIELASPINASNVMVIDPQTKKATRIGYKKEGKIKKRISKKSGEYLD